MAPSAPSRPRRAELWGLPLAVFLVARLVSAVFLTVAARAQPDLTAHPGWHVEGTRPGSPSYLEILSNWDGQWFKTIALHGYHGVSGGDPTEQNALAFSPVHPFVVRGVMTLTGLGFEAAASLVSLSAGAAAVVLLFGWLRRTRGRGPAVSAVVVLSFFPAAPILQTAYSDALALLLLVIVLRAVLERRWPLVVGASAVLAFTRPVLLPVAGFVLLVDLRRGAREGRLPVSRAAVGTAVAVGVLSFGWPLVAGMLAGSPAAYFTSNAAWRLDGRTLGGWFTGLAAAGLTPVAVLMALLLVALVGLRWRRRGQPATADLLGTWAGVYLVYLLLTAPPSAGIVRHSLLTLVPLGTTGPMAAGLTRRRRLALLAVVVLVEVALQWLWVRHVFVVEDPGAARIP